MVVSEFPELADEFEEWPDLLHVQMGAFARLTQRALAEGDWETYDRCIRLADRLWESPNSGLENALNVSYLEHLQFDGPRGPDGWQRLTPRLQAAWNEMNAYLENLANRRPPEPR